jgi:hypothetical protein
MYRHPYFDLWLHNDEELVSALGSDILERVTLHEWPLSCVQQLVLSDRRKLIYKAQAMTFEPEFYAHARSRLLPQAQTLYRTDSHACMLIEFIDAPLIEALDLPEAEVARIGREVIAQIAEIDGDLPHAHDISDVDKWMAFTQMLFAELQQQIEQGKFERTNKALVHDLERWAHSDSILSAIRAKPGYVHRDLTGDNLFVLADGYRLIDWQRPMLAPADLDMVSLLGSLGFDPLHHVTEGTMRVWLLLQIHWFRHDDRWINEYASGLNAPHFVNFC